jgi:probable rRNA maturation factor
MIIFQNEQVNFQYKNVNQVKKWIKEIIEAEGKKAGDLTFVFCSDEYLLKFNKSFLNHDTFTDIITFDYTEGKKISGDIMISIERILENALKFNVTVQDEIFRVMSHGVMHLCGYKDKSRKDKDIMRGKEEQCLARIAELERPFVQ